MSDYLDELRSPDPVRRQHAAAMLAAAALPAEIVVPALKGALDDANDIVRCYAAASLWRLDGGRSEYVQVFVAALASEDLDVRLEVTNLLGELAEVPGVDIDVFLERLTEGLKSEAADLRRATAMAFGAVADSSDVAIPFLVEALGDLDCDVRLEAVCALARHGTAAQDAVSALSDLAVNEADDRIRIASIDALAAIDPSSPIAIRVFVALLSNANDSVRHSAAVGLSNCSVLSEQDCLIISDVLLHERSPGVAYYLLVALGKCSSGIDSFRPLFQLIGNRFSSNPAVVEVVEKLSTGR